jgi:hypothetical protein
MSTKPTKTTDPLIEGAKLHFQAATEHIRKGCAEALITGLHLHALHQRTAGNGHGGNRLGASVPHGTLEKGFREACEEIGIAKTVAYRWMNACGNALLRATIVMDSEDMAASLPEAGTPAWTRWEKALVEAAQGMSLNRLLLGAVKESTEDHRYSELLDADEEGRERATALLQGVSEGKYTLVQAVRALGSLEAYDQLRKEGGEKIRKDPVYLDFDPIQKKAIGLIPKAFTALENGFPRWVEYDDDARAEMKSRFKTVIKAMPIELTELLRK